MQQNNVIDRIELVLIKDENTQKIFTLSQFDYSFSSTPDFDDSSVKKTEVYLSGSINSNVDEFFLQWVSNQVGEWSGSIKVFFKNQNTPELTLTFQNSSINNYNQSFMENNSYSQGAYFAAILKGVVLDNVQMN